MAAGTRSPSEVAGDPFATLGIARRYDLDLRALEKTHRELSRVLHPDRYAGTGASERRHALSFAVEVNDAWRILRDPVRRAEALFRLAGVAVGETNEPKSNAGFLVDIMEQREVLEDAKSAKDRGAVEALAEAIAERARMSEAALADMFARADGDRALLEEKLGMLGELRFYRRFLEEVSAIEDLLVEAV